MDLLKLINDYGRACRRDGSPAWESDEGQALKAALESRASNAGGAVAWQVRAIGSELWENCTRELYEDTLRTGRYCGSERAPECEVRELFAHPAPASKEPVADERCDGCGGEIGDAFCAGCLVDSVGVWLRGIKEDGDRTDNERCAAEILLKLAIEPRAALATAQTKDRAMLESISQDLEISWHYCERCGHGEPCKNMDAAYMLRDYLAAAPAKPEGV